MKTNKRQHAARQPRGCTGSDCGPTITGRAYHCSVCCDLGRVKGEEPTPAERRSYRERIERGDQTEHEAEYAAAWRDIAERLRAASRSSVSAGR